MKRFYKEVSVAEVSGGYSIKLDSRDVKTPLKAELIIPSKELADLVASEWAEQGEKIIPEEMHITRLANTAIDRVEARRDDIIEELSSYSGTDLICYHADYPEALVERQKNLWGPYHQWMLDIYGVTLKATSGIMHVAQDEDVLAKLKTEIEKIDSFRLTALHGFTTGLGSFTLGLAVVMGKETLDTVWQAALVDELFQEEEWGADDEAVSNRKALYFDMQALEKFLQSL